MNIRMVSWVLTSLAFMTAGPIFAQERATLTAIEQQAIESDGKQPVVIGADTFSIGPTGDLLKNGQTMKGAFQASLPHVSKIFGVTVPGTGKRRLVVWFHAKDQRWWGHSKGLYIHIRENWNAWDHFEHMRSSEVLDVTVHRGRLMVVYRGNVWFQVQSSYESGGFSELPPVPASAWYFVNQGDSLHLIATGADSRLQKYRFVGIDRHWAYEGNLNADNLNVELTNKP
jgi:hypothetical protein